MKKKIWMLLLLQCTLFIFSGCSINDFFDVKSTMAPPQISKEETEIEDVVGGYLGTDFKFCQLFTGGSYLSVLKYSFGDARYVVAFCQTQDTDLKSHIILLENTLGNYKVKDDIVKENIRFESAQILDVNSDEFCELVVEGTNLRTDLATTFSWCIHSNGTMEIND